MGEQSFHSVGRGWATQNAPSVSNTQARSREYRTNGFPSRGRNLFRTLEVYNTSNYKDGAFDDSACAGYLSNRIVRAWLRH